MAARGLGRKRYSITITSGEKKLQANHMSLLVPELSAVSAAVETALKKNFLEVEVSVKGDADLHEWCGLAEKGLGGRPRLCEVGGPPYLFDDDYHKTTFQLPDVAKTCGLEGQALIVGAAAASFKVVGKNAELIPHTLIPGPRHTRYACIDRPFEDGDEDDSSEEEDDSSDLPDARGRAGSGGSHKRQASGGGKHKRQASGELEVAGSVTGGYVEPKGDVYTMERRKSLSRSQKGSGVVPVPVAPLSEEVLEVEDEDVDVAAMDDVKDEDSTALFDEGLVPVVTSYPSEETGCLANLFLCEGKQEPLLYIKVKKRIGDLSFTNAVREGLKTIDGVGGDKQVGAGGVFKVNAGKVRTHIMPSFPKGVDLCDAKAVNDWLRFYDFGPDLLMFSCILTDDPTPDKRLHLRLEHTHFYSVSKTRPHEGGHYHIDVTPDTIEYEGYFSLAEYIYRVEDATHNLEVAKAKAAAETT